MSAAAAALVLVMLHSVDGRAVYINPDTVTNLQESRADDDASKQLARGANCIVNFSDGKFVAVAEFCETVREQFERQRP
jgi:hypothetical protein